MKNFAPNATASSLPVFFSVDGTTKVYGNIPGPIPVDGQVTFTFSQPANITVPGPYNSFIVELDIPGDEDASNDTVTRDLFIQKSLSVPHFETFEAGSGYWKDIGTSTHLGMQAAGRYHSSSSGQSESMDSFSLRTLSL